MERQRCVLSLCICCAVVASSLQGSSSVLHAALPRVSSATKEHITVDTLVVGGGISGTTAAYYLQKNGSSVLVAEEHDEVGGCFLTRTEDGYLWEEGPNSFQPTPSIMTLLRDLNLLGDLVVADPSLPRYIFFDGRMHSLPRSLRSVVSNSLLSWRGKIAILLGSMGLVSRRPVSEESIHHFITRHFGREVMERCVDPFISGVYAGDPQHISALALSKVTSLEGKYSRSLFLNALFRSMLRKKTSLPLSTIPSPPPGSLGSVRHGMQSIPKQIRSVLGSRILTSARVTSIQREDRYFVSSITHHNTTKTVRSRNLLLTIPAHRLSSVLYCNRSDAGDECNDTLRRIGTLAKDVYYPPVVSATLAYPVSALRKPPLIGFGHLIPRITGLKTLGTIYASSLFEGRAENGFVMVRNFIGGSTNPTITSHSDEEIVKQVHADLLKSILVSEAPPPRVLSVWRWNKAIPQYEIGHRDRVETMKELAKCVPGLYLSGSYVSGVSVGDCIEYGMTIAKNISEAIMKVKV